MQWGVPSYYSLVRHAGSGAYGSVDVFVDTRSGEMRAIKKINNVFTDGLRVATHAVRELRMLHHLQHPNIISLCDVVVPDSCDAFDDVYLVMQHMPYDLRYVMESGCVLSARHIRHIMYQLVLAIQHIHAAHIIHRDVKPEVSNVPSTYPRTYCSMHAATSSCVTLASHAATADPQSPGAVCRPSITEHPRSRCSARVCRTKSTCGVWAA